MDPKVNNWTSFASKKLDGFWLSMIQINRGDSNSTVDDVGKSEMESNQLPPLSVDPPKDGKTSGRSRDEITLRWLERILILLCFALFAGQLPPDVNESHYLPKAKHFWNPDWAAGDIFLSSSFAHWLFYVTVGWLTKFMSLSAVAWVGRFVTWALLAFAWERMSRAFLNARWISVFSAILFLILIDRFHLAGEWVVGGLEAKGFAYFFVLMALGDLATQSWKKVWPWLGAATAFHVLVGGWAIIAALFSWLGCLWLELDGDRRFYKSFATRVKAQFVPLLIAAIIGLLGVIPPLLSDRMATPEDAAAAQFIYVNHRISHHLTFDAFPTMHIARFTLVVLFWIVLHRWLKHRWMVGYRNLYPLFLFGLGSLMISFGGLLLSGLAEQDDELAMYCARLLRFYWFRLSDFAIPCGTAIGATTLIWYWLKVNDRPGTKLSCIIFVTCIVAAFGVLVFERQSDPRPRADRSALPNYPEQEDRTQGTYKNWLKACNWIAENTPADATFITPSQQQTFKWYSGRAEVVCWKDIPQDAAGILSWKTRLQDLIEPQRRHEVGLMHYYDDQLKALGKHYGATHLLIPQSCVDDAEPKSQLKQVYPEDSNAKSTYVIFELN